MADAVHITDLLKIFDGNIRAIDGISLEIQPGELFFLLGPSGCGKTTLLRSIAGFVTPDAGNIVIGDKDVTAMPPHQRDTGMVFQSYALWPHLTIRQNVAFGLKMRKLPAKEIAQRTDQALERVQMTNRADRKPNELSGGQQQRVALARALVIEPRCLLLDEPLSNLDAKLRLEMRQEIRDICKSAGITAIYVTHDQKEALSIADRIALLNAGKIEQIGTPTELYRQPISVFTAGFIGETNFLPGVIERIENNGCWINTPVGCLKSGSPPHTSYQPQQKVQLSIRPEALRITETPANENAFHGNLDQTIYLGEVAQYQVRAGDAPLKVFELNPRASAARNASLNLAVLPEDIVILPRD